MACVHLKKLYQLCQQEDLRISSSDLIHMVCEQCGVQEECPSMLVEAFDSEAGEEESEAGAGDS